MSLTMIPIINKNLNIFLNLSQAYEAEFSLLTQLLPDKNGLFPTATFPEQPYSGFLFYDGSHPIGFSIINATDTPHDVAEFYIIPARRNNGIGGDFAIKVIHTFPGDWQIRQISGADKARAFWLKVILKLVGSSYEEQVVDDNTWGKVTKQSFTVEA